MSLFSLDQVGHAFLNQSCVGLPVWQTSAGILNLRTSNRHMQGKMVDCLKRLDVSYRLTGNKISLVTKNVTSLSFKFSSYLSSVEQNGVHTTFEPTVDSSPRGGLASCSLRSFIGKMQRRWLANLVRNRRIYSVFQPIIHCTPGRELYGYEALMRATDGDQTIQPDQILDIARATNLLFQVSQVACRTSLLDAALHGITAKLFINVAPINILNADVRDTVNFLETLQVEPVQIVLELVESQQITDWQQLREILDGYRSHGFELAIDDFGAAYSSVRSVNELRPDYVKIDMDLIRDVHLDTYRSALAGKFIEAMKDLRIKTIAEGIQSAGEYNWVNQAGVDYVQGFYISPPAAPPPFMNASDRFLTEAFHGPDCSVYHDKLCA
jgi:EAL domain-containing protein (putative c-di-GMP-specific phosphodiesterase class I)